MVRVLKKLVYLLVCFLPGVVFAQDIVTLEMGKLSVDIKTKVSTYSLKVNYGGQCVIDHDTFHIFTKEYKSSLFLDSKITSEVKKTGEKQLIVLKMEEPEVGKVTKSITVEEKSIVIEMDIETDPSNLDIASTEYGLYFAKDFIEGCNYIAEAKDGNKQEGKLIAAGGEHKSLFREIKSLTINSFVEVGFNPSEDSSWALQDCSGKTWLEKSPFRLITSSPIKTGEKLKKHFTISLFFKSGLVFGQDIGILEKGKLLAGSSVEDYEASIEIDYASVERDINPLLYGNNTKWLYDGEARYNRDNGIWSKKNNAINENIHDWLVNSGIKILRYGDGSNADYFYWGWSIVPWEKRLITELYSRWGGGEHYTFGIMEFIKLCETVKCEGIIIVNYGMGILETFYEPQKHNDRRSKREIAVQQAVNWVEFMNAPAPAEPDPAFPKEYKPEYSLQKMPRGYFAYLRSKLGHPKPVGIKYWEIGNEIDIFHRSGGTYCSKVEVLKPISLEEYVKDAIDFGRAMKAIDPSIKIGLVEWSEWRNRENMQKEIQLAGKASEIVDFLIIHDYVSGSIQNKNPVFIFYSSNVVERPVTVHSGGKYLVHLHAWGRAYFGTKYPEERAVPPKMELKIDGHHVAEIIIDKNIKADKSDLIVNDFHWYEVPVELSPGSHTLSLRMTNDFYGEPFPDINRCGRDVFVDSWKVKGEDEEYEILYHEVDYIIPFQVAKLDKKLSELQELISKFAPGLFLAKTECGTWPSPTNLCEALSEALQMMVDMKYGVRIRNHWHLYGACDRGGVIHSGNAQKESYHYTPTYLAIKMFSEHFGDKLVECKVTSPEVSVSFATTDLETKNKKMSLLHTSASRSPGVLSIAMVNCHTKEEARVRITIKNFHAKNGRLYILSTEDPAGRNSDNETKKDNVFIRSEVFNLNTNVVNLLPNSLTILELRN